MVEQRHLSQQIFSLWLNRDPTSQLGGEIVFGGIDWRRFRGDHTYIPLTQQDYWQVYKLNYLLLHFRIFLSSIAMFVNLKCILLSRLKWGTFLLETIQQVSSYFHSILVLSCL